ncbi:MAG: hypothetical protein [Inoviridae sp.]|nr:MAG: hypothetical protein [Inoviridae sp.]
MNSTFVTTVLNIRFDTMEDDATNRSFDWAHLHFIGEQQHTENFSGVQVAKVRIDTADNNKLAKRLHALGHDFPLEAEITTRMEIAKGEPRLTVIDVQPV